MGVTFEYSVIGVNEEGIEVGIHGPDNESIYKQVGRKQDRTYGLSLKDKIGEFRICFKKTDNRAKKVRFSFEIFDWDKEAAALFATEEDLN